MRRQADVVALVTGVLLTGLAASLLWHSLVSPLGWASVQVVAPVALVLVGVVGLALSRNRS